MHSNNKGIKMPKAKAELIEFTVIEDSCNDFWILQGKDHLICCLDEGLESAYANFIEALETSVKLLGYESKSYRLYIEYLLAEMCEGNDKTFNTKGETFYTDGDAFDWIVENHWDWIVENRREVTIGG